MRAEGIPAPVAAVAALEAALADRGLQAAAVLIERQAQGALLELPAGGWHAFVAIEEVPRYRLAGDGEFHAEGDFGAVDGDGAIPVPGEGLGPHRGREENGSGDESGKWHDAVH